MATPRGAQPRDLEQRFRDLEQRCGDLAARVLGQRKLEVTTGDFAVSGGGGILVSDGGGVTVAAGGILKAEYPNGAVGMTFGPITADPLYDLGLVINNDAGGRVFAVARRSSDGLIDLFTPGVNIIQLYGTSLDLAATGGAGATVNGGPQLNLTGTTVLLNAIGGDVRIPGYTTTGSAANTFMAASGLLQRVTSSLRYKQDVETADIDPDAVLSLQPRTWRDRAEVSENPDTDQRYVGFIAEELDAAGLGRFVEYDDEGRPNAIQYDRLSAALLVVAKRQDAQIAALSARLDALEALQ